MINRSSGFDKFITLFLGYIDLENNEFVYTNAGHDYPYLFRASGKTERLESTGIPIGMLPESKYDESSVQLESGDVLFVYSDGIVDATNADGNMFTEERLAYLVESNTGKSPQEIASAIEKEILKFIGKTPQFDDMTMLILKRD